MNSELEIKGVVEEEVRPRQDAGARPQTSTTGKVLQDRWGNMNEPTVPWFIRKVFIVPKICLMGEQTTLIFFSHPLSH